MNKHVGNNQGDGGSHINNIIDRLREVKDGGNISEERSRDIIERSDGTKVVKVRKRKRVYNDTKKEMNPSTTDFKKWVLILGMAGVIFCIVAIVFLMIRISSFNSEEFLATKEEELGRAWNAKVEIKRLSFEGLSFSIGSVVARFPESSLIKEVSIQRISGNLIPISFITGICQGDLMEISSAKIILRNNVEKMALPDYEGRKLWNYSRYRVDKFEVGYEDPQTAPFRLNTELYVRRSESGDRYNCNLSSRTLSIKGWDPITLTVGSVYVTDEGFEYLDINGTMSESTVVSIKGEFKEGMSFSQPILTLSGVNIPLSSITKNQFTPLVTAEFGVPAESHDSRTSFQFALPNKDQLFPPFSGNSQDIKKLAIKGLPVFKELSEVTGNKAYLSPVLQSGKGYVSSNGNGISFSKLEADEFSFLSLMGTINITADKNVSGQLNIGIPRRASMRGDMIVDPLFVRDDGETVWIGISLSGTLMKPMDNTLQLVRAIKPTREKISRENNLMNFRKPSSKESSTSDDDEEEVSGDSLDEDFRSLLK